MSGRLPELFHTLEKLLNNNLDTFIFSACCVNCMVRHLDEERTSLRLTVHHQFNKFMFKEA